MTQLNETALKEVTELYGLLKIYRAFQNLTDNPYATATISVASGSASKTLSIQASTAAEWIAGQIEATETSLRTYGFEP